MRDALIALIIVGGALYSLRQPWVGVLLWNWISLMNPHEGFGYAAANWPVASIVGGCLLIGTAFTKDRQNPFIGPPMWWLLAFVLWLCITLPFSILFDESYPLWVRSMKIFFMLFVCVSLINTQRKLDWLLWIVVGSIGFFGVKGGVFTLATGGSYRVWGPGGFIQGNNEVALAVLMVIPFMYYIHQCIEDRRLKWLLVVAMVMSGVTCLGSHSRGALLGLIGMGAVFWLRGNQKFTIGVLLLVVGAASLSFMPEEWWERMGTIKTYDQDTSAMGRINAWYMAFNLAKDRIFGGGFMVWTGSIFAVYAPNPNDPHAAHSIYFQVLGEHGFIGLFLFLAIGVSTLFTTLQMIRLGSQHPQLRWLVNLGRMIQVSMVGYAIAGAFLSLAYYDLPYLQVVLAVLGLRIGQVQVTQAEADRSISKADPREATTH